ncbi:hypothetical protein [Klebsiella phage phiKp_21]|nr:hypothetical protein [Klebsiella phage phiKp_21]
MKREHGNIINNLKVIKELSTAMILLYKNMDKINADNYILSTTRLNPYENGSMYLRTKASQNIIGILNESVCLDAYANKDEEVPGNYRVIIRDSAFFLCSPMNPFFNKIYADFNYTNGVETFPIPSEDTWEEEMFQLSLVVPNMVCTEVLELYKEIYNNIERDFYISYEYENYDTTLLKDALNDVNKFIKHYINK